MYNARGLGVSEMRSRVKNYICGGDIVAGDWVKWDLSVLGEGVANTVVQGTNVAFTFGVALEGGLAGDTIQVCTQGYCSNCKTGGAVAAGDAVVAAAAGSSVTLAVPGILPILAVALKDDVGTVGEMYLLGVSVD